MSEYFAHRPRVRRATCRKPLAILIQMPAPFPNSLPKRTAIFGEIGLRSFMMS
jgi:hypothetical protein